MKTTSSSNEFYDTAQPVDLTRMGWTSFFSEQLTEANSDSTPARIVGVRKNIYLARQGAEEHSVSLAGRLFNGPQLSLPAPGDWVLLQDSRIISILRRKNVLSRGASGGRSRKNPHGSADEQVIAANLDRVCIVCGLDRDFNVRRIERYLTLVYNCGMEPVVLLTKADLHADPAPLVQQVEVIAFGTAVYVVSAHEPILHLHQLVPPGQTVALIGSSGAGKSTLINRLYGEDIQATSEVGARVGKGRHTTTTRDLIVLPSGGMVIDNPGIREVALSMESAGSLSAFPEIEEAARFCRFADCSHSHEPGCRVQEQVSCGNITPGRLQNFRKLQNEQGYYVQREQTSAARVEKDRWKAVSQKAKALKKRREK